MYTKDCGSTMGLPVLVTIWTTAAIAIIIVTLRFYSQRQVVHKLDWPDLCILLSLITALVSTALNTEAIAHALGNHMICLTTPGKLEAMQWQFVGIVPGALSTPLARISFCLYMLPFGGICKKWRVCFWIIIIAQAFVNIGCMVGALVNCGRSSAPWDLTHANICWASNVMVKALFAQGAFNAATDLALTVVPFLILRRLRMARSTKVALSILLGMSVLTMAACILKTVELFHLSQSKDLTYDTARYMIWLALEHYIAIIAVSIPPVRPLALQILRHRLRWFRTPLKHRDQNIGDRTWISRNPTRFTFDTELQTFDQFTPKSLPRPEGEATDDHVVELAFFLNSPVPSKPRRGASIRKTVTIERIYLEKKEENMFDKAYIEVRGLSKSAVGGPGICLDGIWDK